MSRYEFYKIGNRTIAIPLSFDEGARRDVYGYLITAAICVIIFGILSMVLPAILFMIYFFTATKKSLITNNIIAIIFCSYFLFDYSNGWICFTILTDLCDTDKWLIRFATLNLGLLVTNGILLIHNIRNRNKEFKEEGNNLDSINIVVLMVILSVYLSSYMIKNNLPSKYIEPPKTEAELKEEHNQMY